jgi:hypothetical protein
LRWGKRAEARDDRLVPSRKVEIERGAERREELDRACLIVARLGMLERHIDEGTLLGREAHIQPFADRVL